MLPSSPATGGNVIIPGSHKLFESIPNLYTERLSRIDSGIHHFRFPIDDPLLALTPPIMPHIEAGDLLLWDSRTVHCSSPAIGAEGDPRRGLLRAASLVCMMPRSRSNASVIARRREALASRTSTTNWSDRFIDADQFPQVLAEADRSFVLPPIPQLSPEQDALVG